jgi:hypothetical protein
LCHFFQLFLYSFFIPFLDISNRKEYNR